MKVFLLISILGVALVSSCPTNQEQENGKRLIKTSEKEPAQWMDEDQIWSLIEKHQNFVDVTGHNFPDIKPEDINTQGIY
jgi:hypothetical protein